MRVIVVMAVTAVALCAQGTTIVNGGRINKGTIDNSGATHTLPAIVVALAASLPSSGCTPGELAVVTEATPGRQIYQNSGTDTCVWTQQLNGGSVTGGCLLRVTGSTVSYDPLDSSCLVGIEDFCTTSLIAGITANSFQGKWLWNVPNTGNVSTVDVLPAGCGIKMVTTSTASYSAVQLTPASGVRQAIINPATTPNWEVDVVVSIPTLANSSFGYAIGAQNYSGSCGTSGPGSVSAYCVGIRSDNGGNWKLNTCDSSFTCNSVDTTVTPVAGTKYKLRLYANAAGTIYASVNGSTPVSSSSKIPNGNYGLALAAGNNGTTNSLETDLYRVSYLVTSGY